MTELRNLSETHLIEALVAALADTPGAHAWLKEGGDLAREPHPIDALIDLEMEGARVRLVVETKRSAFPRDVREAVWRLRGHLSHVDSPDRQMVPMVVAESLSPGARSYLREANVGYFDAGGSLFLPARGAYVYIDKPAPRAGKRAVDSVFTGRRALVIHALWEHREDWVGVHQLAAAARVSPATASETLSALEKRDWLEIRGSGPTKERRLVDARGLLDAWTEHQKRARPPNLRHYFVPVPGLNDLLPRLDEAFEQNRADYLITGEAAAQVYAPYLSSVSQLRCRVLEGPRADAALHALDARPVREGWNLGVIESKAEGDFAFRQRDREAWIASPLQAYLDLVQGSGRSWEMAEHLRAERLDA